MNTVIKRVQQNHRRITFICLMACLLLSCDQSEQTFNANKPQTLQKITDDTDFIERKDSLSDASPAIIQEQKKKKPALQKESPSYVKKKPETSISPSQEAYNEGNKYNGADEDVYYNNEEKVSAQPVIQAPSPSIKGREQFLKSKGLTLDRLKNMAFMFVRMNTENLKSVQEIYDSGSMDKVVYERTKLGIEKNLRIIRLLNQIAQEKTLNDIKFAAIYLDQLVAVAKDGLIVSQEVLRYLQSIYDTEQVSQQKYIASADNLKTNVNLMWNIIKELDF